MIYAVSDLHGYPLEKFLECLKKINFSDNDFLYVLGDCIDRGPDGIKILKWLMYQYNTQLILGNHEAMMLASEFIFDEITENALDNLTGSKLIAYMTWMSNSAEPTVTALSAMRYSEIKYILQFLKEAPLYEALTVNDRDFLLTHSGLGNFSKDKKLSEYTENDLTWNRPTLETRYFDDITVVFGHTPTVYLDEKYKGRAIVTDTWIDIDVGAGLGLDPMFLRLDDMKEIYFD